MTEGELEQRVNEAGGFLETRLPDRRHCWITHGPTTGIWICSIYAFDNYHPDANWSAHDFSQLTSQGKERYNIDISTVTLT
jgi:hypothetical protein